MRRVPLSAGRTALLFTVACLIIPLIPHTSVVGARPVTPGSRGPGEISFASTATGFYPVNFTEGGLPSGANWTVTLGTVSRSTTGRTILFYVPNGTYAYSIGSVGGYVPAEAVGNVTVQGGNDTVVATLGVAGAKPWGGALDPLTGNIFMAYHQNGNLSVINGTTRANGGNIPVGRNPGTPIYDALDGDLFVPNAASNNLTVVDPTTYARVANVGLAASPVAGAFDPANGLVYIADNAANRVSVVNSTNFTVVATLNVGNAPSGVAYDPIDRAIYVTNEGSDNISVINGTSDSVGVPIPLPAQSGPFGIAFDAVNGQLYVTLRGSAACAGGGGPCSGALVNASTDAYDGTFVEGSAAAYPSFDAANGLLYVPNAVNPGTITVLSGAGPNPVGVVSVGSTPGGVVADPANGLLYSANFAANTISVIAGTLYNESVEFVPRPPTLYSVAFTESGLPAGTGWSVSVNGTRYGATGSIISLSEDNGTYPFVVGTVGGFHDVPASGSFTVNGTNQSTPIVFTPISPPTYPITFVATGLPIGTPWAIVFDGVRTNSTGTSLVFQRSNGTYNFSVAPVSQFRASPASGSVSVNGTASTLTITYSAVPRAKFGVSFLESGLPSGTMWSVTVGSAVIRGNATQLTVNETNGTYAFTVPVDLGFTATPSSGVINVTGTNQTLTLGFTLSPAGGTGGTSGGGLFGALRPYGLGFVAVIAVVVSVLLLASLLWLRRRRAPQAGLSIPSVAAAAGFPAPLAPQSPSPPGPEPADSLPPPPALPRSPPEGLPKKPDWSEE